MRLQVAGGGKVCDGVNGGRGGGRGFRRVRVGGDGEYKRNIGYGRAHSGVPCRSAGGYGVG